MQLSYGGSRVSKKREGSNTTIYYINYPIYASKEMLDSIVSITMGNVWLKAVARDSYKKKYGILDVEDIDEIEFYNYMK